MGPALDRYSLTLLRHPIRTIMSTYEYGRTYMGQNLSVSAAMAKLLSFLDWVRYFADSPLIIRNSFTHHFAAVSMDHCDPPAELMLQNAKHNLAAFNFVGIAEQLLTCASLLCEELGWPSPAVEPH